MSCYHPITGYDFGLKSNGKKDIRWSKNYSDKPCIGEVKIPCGKCIGCRLQYSRIWADRMIMELQDHDSAYFLTLTYDDSFINSSPYGEVRRFYTDSDTGEAKLSLSLCKSHLQNFWKSLRQEFHNDHIRYFACGEYGSKTKRPHYHAIVYGLHLDDLQFYKRSNLNDVYFNSPRLDKVWKKGFVVVGQVTWNSCAYVARYVVKKAQSEVSNMYSEFNMIPEFVVMSRRPGIGKNYYVNHKYDFIDFGETYESDGKRSLRFQMPRYFESIMELENPEELKKYKDMKSYIGKTVLDSKLSITDLSERQLLEVEENAKIASTKALVREIYLKYN